MVNMNQRSHFQDSPVRDQPMDETLVVQLVKYPKGKHQEYFKLKWYFMFLCILVLGIYVRIYPSKGNRSFYGTIVILS